MEELRQQQATLSRMVVRIRHLLYLVGVGVATVAVMFALIITYIVYSSQGNRESTCALIETSRAEKRAQLRAYDETPPSTETGRNIQVATQQSLAAWDSLANSLRCKEVGSG